MLAPSGVIRKMESLIKKFFWKGGKQNMNKLPLVSWDKVTKPILEGGLNFKDLRLQNLALGAKLLWRQVAPKAGWAQRALWKKYFAGTRKRCLDRPVQGTIGSQILKLCEKALPIIQNHLYWVPGNGKTIDLWEDRIMNDDPLAEDQELRDLSRWMKNAGLVSLWDISNWKDKEWVDWKKPELPIDLASAWQKFRLRLKGKAPTHEEKHDQRGWGSKTGAYTVEQGYKKLREVPHVPPCPAMWKGLLLQRSIPKIDIFNWLLCHNRILTADNLRRKGFHGPSRCYLCLANEENAQHLFLECRYAEDVWSETLRLWTPGYTLPSTIFDLYTNWMQCYPGQLPNKSWFKAGWLVLPKLVCWHLWLERNNRIFQEKPHTANAVRIKIKASLKEILSEMGGKNKDTNPSNEEKEWAERLGIHIPKAEGQKAKIKDWQIKMAEDKFRKKNEELTCHSLFFDGAAKGNPGNIGAGGVIKNMEGQVEHRYAWGLGQDTNTQAEAMALLQGLKVLQKVGIKEAMVFGDSQTVIKMLVENSKPKDLRLTRILMRIRKISSSFQSLSFSHVLRNNNKEADEEANRAALLPKGMLILDEKEEWAPIP